MHENTHHFFHKSVHAMNVANLLQGGYDKPDISKNLNISLQLSQPQLNKQTKSTVIQIPELSYKPLD
jgi:hypothetical protein